VTQFETAVRAWRRRFDGIGAGDELTVVFDAGMDSAANLALVEDLDLYFVGSVPPPSTSTFFAVPQASSRVVDHDELPGVTAFESQKLILGRNVRVVLTHSAEFHTEQIKGFRSDAGESHRNAG
jgi:hypothetical protein